jgi:hypothetical protein
MKTNAYFKLPKEFKRMLSCIDNAQQRGETKKLFVEAQATYIDNKNKRFKERVSLGDE